MHNTDPLSLCPLYIQDQAIIFTYDRKKSVFSCGTGELETTLTATGFLLQKFLVHYALPAFGQDSALISSDISSIGNLYAVRKLESSLYSEIAGNIIF